MPLTIVAHVHAKPGREETVRGALEKLVAPTRTEAGCLQYDLHQDIRVSGHFMFYESWASRELWQAHMRSAHIAAYTEATEGAVDRFLVDEMERVA